MKGARQMLTFKVADREGDSVTVCVEGELVGDVWSKRFARFMEDHFVDDGVKTIRIDIEPLRRLDEDGLAALIKLRLEARRKKKALFVQGAAGQVRGKLQVAGMLHKLEDGD